MMQIARREWYGSARPRLAGRVGFDHARYWFEQYRSASQREARLIREIEQLSDGRIGADAGARGATPPAPAR